MENIPVITIDGPSGAGKGTVAIMLSKDLKWNILDSGALYRTLAFVLEQRQIDLENFNSEKDSIKEEFDVCFRPGTLSEPVKVIYQSKDITELVRTEKIALRTSIIAASEDIRQFIRPCQREFLKKPGLVADGRDMGTIIFPEADLKIFLTASLEERAKRRQLQLKRQGTKVNMRVLLEELETRDKKDREREHSPLRLARDSHVIDTSNLSPEGVVKEIKSLSFNILR